MALFCHKMGKVKLALSFIQRALYLGYLAWYDINPSFYTFRDTYLRNLIPFFRSFFLSFFLSFSGLTHPDNGTSFVSSNSITDCLFVSSPILIYIFSILSFADKHRYDSARLGGYQIFSQLLFESPEMQRISCRVRSFALNRCNVRLNTINQSKC